MGSDLSTLHPLDLSATWYGYAGFHSAQGTLTEPNRGGSYFLALGSPSLLEYSHITAKEGT